MATAIKAIPTLYGEEAARFRKVMEEGEREYDAHPRMDIRKDPIYVAMKQMLKRSGML